MVAIVTGIDPYLSLIPQAILEIDCGSQTHQLAWSGGRLTTLDHHDVEGERTLAALGGTRNACLDHLDAWHRHHHDLRILALTSRGASDPLGAPEASGGWSGASRPFMGTGPRPAPGLRRSSRAYGSSWVTGWVSSTGSGPAPALEPEDDYTTLLSLGAGLPERLAATVAAHWAQRLETAPASPAQTPALYAALASRAWLTVRAWAGDPGLDVQVIMIDPQHEAGLVRNGSGVTLSLPFRWLSRVWAPNLANTAGRLVLDARRESDSLELLTADGTTSPSFLRISM